ncbi:XRE family transcriptional regulator [bacterium C-53]|nr:XRE family transcriptional regulator [Lachnospiraceae bacterium]NBI03347.1 XRE family transcriptional regulator [Lachnospiraceae bacterium]RKJ09884.1 XRE family transcriptional regulator [bacterium C-53]
MKINQIIREKRKELSLTQEQVAGYLGVSAPAVNKWEKGITYPDITLLPALARLLQTDLNTLMSFKDDLTEIEIENFVKEIEKTIHESNYETAFQMAIDKLRDYPTCDKLISSVIFYLEGTLFLCGVSDTQKYKTVFETYYERLSVSKDAAIRESAVLMLISYYRNRGDFSRAEELIQTLHASSIDKEEQLAVLYTRQKEYTKALEIWNSRILVHVGRLQTALMHMLDIAAEEDRFDDAAFYADLYETLTNRFCLVKWTSYSARLELAFIRQDKEECLSVLGKMLPAMKEAWDLKDCPLYRNIHKNVSANFSTQLARTILKDLKEKEEFAFLRQDRKFEELLKENAGSI